MFASYRKKIEKCIIFVATVSVDIFAQVIFFSISPRALDTRKYGVSEKINHKSTDRISFLTTRKCTIGLDA